MADITDTEKIEVKKPSKIPLLLGVVLCLAGAGVGFFSMYSGVILSSPSSGAADVKEDPDTLPVAKNDVEIAFLPIEPLIISLSGETAKHLRFRAQLEVEKSAKEEVEHLIPRVVDVLNGYLRAVEMSDLQDNASLARLRAQMLRRVQVVAGGRRVRDLLIMEFVLN